MLLKNIKYKTDIIKPVKTLNWNEFITAVRNDFLTLLPIEKPITPSVEKAYASSKKAANVINWRSIALTAKRSSPSLELWYVNHKKAKVISIVLIKISKLTLNNLAIFFL